MEPLANSVTELELADGERIFIAPMGTKDVVTVEGSVLGGASTLSPGKEVVQSLVTDLLDAGTAKHGKDELREALAARGISLSFDTGIDRTFFSGSCLPEDLGYLLATVAECLSSATFPAKELALAKERALGSLEEAKTDTNYLAANALNRAAFDPSHLNHPYTIAERMKQIAAVTRADLVAFRKQLGRTGLVLAITGDVTVPAAERAVRAAITKLPKGISVVPAKKPNAKKPVATETLIPIKDKANIDTYLGVAVPMTYDHPLYTAFNVFCGMLGGRGLSSGHLMRTIRERDGLTYGIYVRAGGFSGLLEGAFRIWATFSPATFKVAVEKTRKEIKTFLSTGLTSEALIKKQDQIAGAYVVGLSTTGGLAGTLHSIGVEGKPLSYIDAFPDLVRAVTVDDLKAVAELIPFDKLSLAASGSFEK